MPEEWEETRDDEPRQVPLSGRVELLEAVVGVGDHSHLIDQEEADATGVEPGIENVPLVTLDLAGHLHPGGVCIPITTPYLLTGVALDQLISGLCEAREQLDARYPYRERRSPQ